MAAKRSIYWILMAFVAFAVLYVYFLPFETHILYGDDLFLYKNTAHLHTFSDWFTCSTISLKFRPVTSLLNGLLVYLFDKDLHGYYVFNVFIQTCSALLFTRLAYTLITSLPLSFLTGLLAGTTRFAFYNITQVSCGGTMEGLCIIFFLCMTYSLLLTFTRPGNNSKQNFTQLLLAILFANLALYTHERYIVLFPFIILVAWSFPYKHKLLRQHTIIITALAIVSVAANVLIKKLIFGLPFFLGTGGQQIQPDAKSALLYLSQGVLSILQINAGSESMIGVSALGIEHVFQFIIAVCGIAMLVLLRLFLVATRKDVPIPYPSRSIMLFLLVLFLLCMAPAISTVRLEQRWLQASLCIFLLMLTLAFERVNSYTLGIRNGYFSVLLLLFLLSDHNYLHKGAKKMFMTRSANVARTLVTAAERGVIKQDAKHLYFEEDWWLYTEWVTEQGYLFTCYGKPVPPISFINDLKLDHDNYLPPLPDFHAGDQVLRVKEDTVYDVTNKYLSPARKEL